MDASSGKQKSLYRKLTIALVVLVSLVSTAVNLFNYLYSLRESEALYQRKSSEYSVYLRDALEWPLWNIDDELIAKVGSAFASNAEIVTFIIRDDQQRVIYHREKPNGHELKREIAIEHNGENIGSVEIGLSLSAYEQRNRQLLLASIATMILLIVAMLGATRWILSRLLKKPVDAFVGATSDMVEGKYLQIELPETYVEFAPILSGFKTMTDAVASRESSLRQTNEQLAAEIGDRKRAEDELRKTQSKLIAAQKLAAIGSWEWDVRSDVANWSDETFRIFGIDKNGLKEHRENFLDMILAEDRNKVDQALADALEGVRKYDIEYRVSLADGTNKVIHALAEIIRDAEGKPMAMTGTVQDITERKRMEEALRANEERLKLATSAGNIGIWDWDIVENVLTWGESMYVLYGIRKEDFGGAYDAWVRTLHPDDRQFADGEIQAALRSEREYAPEFRIIRPDGTVRNIKAASKTYYDPHGNPTRMVGTNFDITALKQTEDELRKYKDHLEEEVQLRTADLVLARNAAEAANRAKSVFLSSMSHELRTPLNAILGFSSLMRKDPLLRREQRDNLDIINRSGEHLLTLINDVLEMAKIEAGRVQVESTPFDLGGLVRDVTDMMHMRAQEKGLQLLVDQSSEFPRYIMGDEARLRQVLTNLVGNAVKFTSQGGITVRFGMKPNALPQHLLIEVEDSGIGIQPEDQQRIFEPFMQLGQTAAQAGTGLGLTITRQFVQMMGGGISVASTPGVGSTFRVELPMVKVAAVDVLKPESAGGGEIVGLAPGQPKYRILIVEDQLENQLLLSKLMSNLGFPVKVTENGERALGLFQSWQPQLIWMDRRMPVMDGLEATRRIRALPGGKEVKIIAVTASAFTEQRAEMLAAGMDDFVRKPYRFNEIYECLSRQLGVQYIYADTPVAEEVSDGALTADMLALLPPELRRELHDALESLENERITAVIQQVEPYDAKLHKTLSRLAENFDYPNILKALQTNQPGNVS